MRTVKLWWDDHDPENTGWAYTVTETDADGFRDIDSGPLDTPSGHVDDDALIDIFRAECPDWADVDNITIDG